MLIFFAFESLLVGVISNFCCKFELFFFMVFLSHAPKIQLSNFHDFDQKYNKQNTEDSTVH